MTRPCLPWLPCFIALTACNPFVFDDLKDETWVQVVERDNTRTSGDFGTDVRALPPPAEGGVRLLIGAGVVPGLARITLGPDGDVVEHIGNDATGAGLLRPLKSCTPPCVSARAPPTSTPSAPRSTCRLGEGSVTGLADHGRDDGVPVHRCPVPGRVVLAAG
jgi:hypothetical protein